jgi:hypothetical protein
MCDGGASGVVADDAETFGLYNLKSAVIRRRCVAPIQMLSTRHLIAPTLYNVHRLNAVVNSLKSLCKHFWWGDSSLFVYVLKWTENHIQGLQDRMQRTYYSLVSCAENVIQKFFFLLPVYCSLFEDIQQLCWRSLLMTCRRYIRWYTSYLSSVTIEWCFGSS